MLLVELNAIGFLGVGGGVVAAQTCRGGVLQEVRALLADDADDAVAKPVDVTDEVADELGVDYFSDVLPKDKHLKIYTIFS